MRTPRIDVSSAIWRKSSYSNSDGGACVEVASAVPTSATDFTTASWRKSSYSNTDGGACVEVADDFPTLVPVRDSKVPDGPVLAIPSTAWTPFIEAIQRHTL